MGVSSPPPAGWKFPVHIQLIFSPSCSQNMLMQSLSFSPSSSRRQPRSVAIALMVCVGPWGLPWPTTHRRPPPLALGFSFTSLMSPESVLFHPCGVYPLNLNSGFNLLLPLTAQEDCRQAEGPWYLFVCLSNAFQICKIPRG